LYASVALLSVVVIVKDFVRLSVTVTGEVMGLPFANQSG